MASKPSAVHVSTTLRKHRALRTMACDFKTGKPQKDEKCFRLQNPHILGMENDFLYHLALGTESHDLVKMFGDVKFVCMGGSNKRMEDFANHLRAELDHDIPTGEKLVNYSEASNRFCLYKVGPVISVSHSMGFSSLTILLHEMIKLMHHARCVDPVFIRIGTSGGIGVQPGTVVVTDGALTARLRTDYEIPILGEMVKRPAVFDRRLAEEIKSHGDLEDGFETVLGKTMAASDFYEEQGRLDGAFCDYDEKDKLAFLKKLHANGVRNIEMEAVPFGAMTHRAGIRGAIVCVTLLNRLNGDQVLTPKSVLHEWEFRPQKIVTRFIKHHLKNSA